MTIPLLLYNFKLNVFNFYYWST